MQAQPWISTPLPACRSRRASTASHPDVAELAAATGFPYPVTLSPGVWALLRSIPPRWQHARTLEHELRSVFCLAAFALTRAGHRSEIAFVVPMALGNVRLTLRLRGEGDGQVAEILLPEE